MKRFTVSPKYWADRGRIKEVAVEAESRAEAIALSGYGPDEARAEPFVPIELLSVGHGGFIAYRSVVKGDGYSTEGGLLGYDRNVQRIIDDHCEIGSGCWIVDKTAIPVEDLIPLVARGPLVTTDPDKYEAHTSGFSTVSPADYASYWKINGANVTRIS